MKDKLKILIPCFLLVLVGLVLRFFHRQSDPDFGIMHVYASMSLLAITALYFLFLGVLNRKYMMGLISIILFLLLSTVLLKTMGKIFRLPVAVHSLIIMRIVFGGSIVLISYLIFQNRRLLIPMLIFIGILMLGELSKQMHWPGAGIAILIGYLGLFITYSIRFILKKEKQTIDFIKWILVAVITIVTPVVMLHWSGNVGFNTIYYNYIKEPLIWLCFLILIIQIDVKRPIVLDNKVFVNPTLN